MFSLRGGARVQVAKIFASVFAIVGHTSGQTSATLGTALNA